MNKKKWLYGFLLITLMALMVACGDDSDEVEQNLTENTNDTLGDEYQEDGNATTEDANESRNTENQSSTGGDEYQEDGNATTEDANESGNTGNPSSSGGDESGEEDGWVEYQEGSNDGKLESWEVRYEIGGGVYGIQAFYDYGRGMKQSTYSGSGELMDYSIHEFDENGNEVKYTKYYADGTLWEVAEFDENGRCVKQTYFDTEGVLEYYAIHEHDENGDTTKSTYYNADGSLDSVYEY